MYHKLYTGNLKEILTIFLCYEVILYVYINKITNIDFPFKIKWHNKEEEIV